MSSGGLMVAPGGGDVCSAKHARWLVTPLRRLVTDPKRILRGLIAEGDHALDLGCGPGFFTLPMAEMVGPRGRVTAVDLQAEMLSALEKRARHRGHLERIRLHQCTADSLGELDPADFALAFHMVHEVPDVARFVDEVAGTLRSGGRLLLAEPRGHVTAGAFEATLGLAAAAGLTVVSRPRVALSRGALLERS